MKKIKTKYIIEDISQNGIHKIEYDVLSVAESVFNYCLEHMKGKNITLTLYEKIGGNYILLREELINNLKNT